MAHHLPGDHGHNQDRLILPPTTRGQIVAAAMRYTGVPYVWPRETGRRAYLLGATGRVIGWVDGSEDHEHRCGAGCRLHWPCCDEYARCGGAAHDDACTRPVAQVPADGAS